MVPDKVFADTVGLMRAAAGGAVEHAQRFGGLPVVWCLWMLWLLRPNGEVVIFNTEADYFREPEVEVRSDRITRIWALVTGVKRYPELAELLPQREPGATDCRYLGVELYASRQVIVR